MTSRWGSHSRSLRLVGGEIVLTGWSFDGEFICSVPSEFLDDYGIVEAAKQPLDFLADLARIIATSEPTGGRYWPVGDESYDAHHVATRVRDAVRSHVP